MSAILQIRFPEDFNKRYHEFREVLLNAIEERGPKEEKPEKETLEQDLKRRFGGVAEQPIQEKSLHSKIETAKKLLLKENVVNNKTHGFPSLEKNFHLSGEGLINLADDGLVSIKNYFLNQGYINEYKRQGAVLEANHRKLMIASTGGGSSFREWKNPLADKHCNLGKGMFEKLTKEPEMELDGFNFRGLITNNEIATNFIKFDIEFSPKALQEFLDEKVDLFINDELDLAHQKHQMHFGYQKQKEQFFTAIKNQLQQGFPANNLKINFTQIWDKNIILQTDFLETALGMEREGYIQIKEIIERENPDNNLIVTSDDFWKYPTTIQLKILDKFPSPTSTIPAQQNISTPVKENVLADETLKPEKSVGNLAVYTDGTVRYGGKVLGLRPQIKELCRYFIEHPNRLVTIDDIKDNVIRAKRRTITPNDTIAKYVSELRNSLNPHFKKDVFPNQKEEGWYFEP